MLIRAFEGRPAARALPDLASLPSRAACATRRRPYRHFVPIHASCLDRTLRASQSSRRCRGPAYVRRGRQSGIAGNRNATSLYPIGSKEILDRRCEQPFALLAELLELVNRPDTRIIRNKVSQPLVVTTCKGICPVRYPRDAHCQSASGWSGSPTCRGILVVPIWIPIECGAWK